MKSMIFNSTKKLFSALERGDTYMFKKLFPKGGNPNARNSRGDSLLMVAVKNQLVDIAMDLVDAGAEIKIIDSSGKNLLLISLGLKNPDLSLFFLRKGLKANPGSMESRRYIRSLIEMGDLELIRKLTEAGLELGKILEQEPEMVLSLARKESVKLLEFLFRHGAPVDVIDREGNNLLHIAVKEGCPDFIEWLVDKGVSKHWKNINGLTPFDDALHCGKFSCARILLDNKSDLDVPSVKVNRLYEPCMDFWKKVILNLNEEMRNLQSVKINTLGEIIRSVSGILESFSTAFNSVVGELQECYKESIDVQLLKLYAFRKVQSISPESLKYLALMREMAEGEVIRLLLLLKNLALTEMVNFNSFLDPDKAIISLPGGTIIEGGQGKSPEDALIVCFAKNNHEGILAEHLYLNEFLEEVEKVKLARPHFEYEGRLYDELIVEFSNGDSRNYFFDITNFFGLHSEEEINQAIKDAKEDHV